MKVHQPVPIFFGHIERGFGKAESRTVDQHQPELSILDEFGYGTFKRANVFHLAEIGTNYVSGSAPVFNGPLYYKKLLLIAADQDDFRPCSVVRKSKRASNALACSGDNCQAPA